MIWTDPNFTPDPALTVKLFDTPDGPYLISQKQLEIMQACREPNGRHKYVFVASEKYTGKTISCLDSVLDHAFNTKNARICIIATSIGAGDDSGVWTKLTDKHIPQWIAGDFGFNWWKGGARPKDGPKMKGASKKLYVELENKFGGMSHIELNSIVDERQVERLFFNRYFSMVYLCELQNFKLKTTFTAILSSLRIEDIPDEQHIFLCDGNPSPEGKRSWQYKLWFEFRTDQDIPDEQKPLQQNLRLLTIKLDDNPFLSDHRKREIKAQYSDDPALYARYVLGHWVEASSDSIFIDVFKPVTHIVGYDAGNDPDVLVPSESAIELYSSWDFGPANPAVEFFEQTFPDEWKAHSDPKHELCRFHFFDELAFLGVKTGELSLASFTELVLERMRGWEGFLGRKIKWTHFSDRSVLDTSQVVENRLQYTEVLAASNGEIELIAVDRRPGTVSAAIRFWRKLLFQQRLLFSAEKCPGLIAAQTGLTRARGPMGPIPYSIAKGNPHKHCWDAARYGVTYLCWEEIMSSLDAMHTINRSEMRIVSVNI